MDPGSLPVDLVVALSNSHDHDARWLLHRRRLDFDWTSLDLPTLGSIVPP